MSYPLLFKQSIALLFFAVESRNTFEVLSPSFFIILLLWLIGLQKICDLQEIYGLQEFSEVCDFNQML